MQAGFYTDTPSELQRVLERARAIVQPGLEGITVTVEGHVVYTTDESPTTLIVYRGAQRVGFSHEDYLHTMIEMLSRDIGQTDVVFGMRIGVNVGEMLIHNQAVKDKSRAQEREAAFRTTMQFAREASAVSSFINYWKGTSNG